MGNLGLLAYSIQWGSLGPLGYGGETGANFRVAWLCEKLVYFKMYPLFWNRHFLWGLYNMQYAGTVVLWAEFLKIY